MKRQRIWPPPALLQPRPRELFERLFRSRFSSEAHPSRAPVRVNPRPLLPLLTSIGLLQ